jgi:hypothetical protein
MKQEVIFNNSIDETQEAVAELRSCCATSYQLVTSGQPPSMRTAWLVRVAA